MKTLWTILAALCVASIAFTVASPADAKNVKGTWSCVREQGETEKDRELTAEDRLLIEETVNKFQGVRGVSTTNNSVTITWDNRFRSPAELQRAIMDHGFMVDGARPDVVYKPRPKKKPGAEQKEKK